VLYNKHTYRLQLFFIFFFISISISFLSYYFIYEREKDVIVTKYQSLALSEIELKEKILLHEIDDKKIIINYILNNDSFLKYVNSLDDSKKLISENIFLTIFDSLKNIYQLKFLDENGIEKIRIEKDKETKQVYSQNNLQNKSHKHYFKEIKKLNKNQFFISDFDLNIKNGEIESPVNPTIRVGTPIYIKNSFKGAIIINLSLKELFKNISFSKYFNIYLIDSNSFVFNPKENRKKSKTLNKQETKDSKSELLDENIIYSKLTLKELSTIYEIIDSNKNRLINENIIYSKLNLKNWSIVYKIKEDLLNSELNGIFYQSSINFIAFIFINIILALIASIIPERLYKKILTQEEELDRNLNIIDKYIIYSKTNLKGVIIEASEAFEKISAYSKSELIGSSHSLIKSGYHDKAFFKDIWKTISKGETWQGEIANRKKDGKIYWVYSTIMPTVNENGKSVGYISIRQDITDKKNLQMQKMKILEQSRHTTMGEMISIIAHQWKQPINYIGIKLFSFITKVEGKKLTQNETEEFYNDMTDTLDGMSKVIDDFRNFFRKDKKLEKVEIREQIEKSLKLLENLIRELDVKVEIKENSKTYLEGIATEILQIFLNLIKNSCDEFKSKQIKNPTIEISICNENSFINIDILDNAGGVDEAIIDKIFEPYFSTKSENGTGIGLYMCKLIVEESLHGEMSLKNVDRGLEFNIKIPKKD